MRVKIEKDGTLSLTDFNALQAYKIAVKVEAEAIQFYRDLLDKAKDGQVRQEISFLVEQETEHKKRFETSLEKEKKTEEDSFEEDDIVTCLNAHVFDESLEKETVRVMDHRHTGLEEAMNMEKRSIFFYEGCLKAATDPAARKAFEVIVEEEKKHLKKFADLLRNKCINSEDGCIL